MKKFIIILIVFSSLVVLGFFLWSVLASNVEQAKYQVISSEGKFEVRQYNPSIIAEVKTEGNRKESITKGFRLLADYIFGNNTKNIEIDMTAPVTQQFNGENWSIRFFMPSKYTLNSLPQPSNKVVKLAKISGKTFIVIRFSGLTNKDNISKHEKKLNEYLISKNIDTVSPTIYAFYNPPWTIPFLRRNEIMREIKKDNY